MKNKIENLLREYKNNKAEINMLTFRLDLNAIDYSKDCVQTSNISSLDNIIIAREKKMTQLKEDVNIVDSLLSTLSERELKIIKGFYIDKKSMPQIAVETDYTSVRSVFRVRDGILDRLICFYEKVI